ncbi:tumor necrosis factor receptor superfamily member 10B-like protein [Cricetulus griseus]|nr:tumor necrosis factor receptor superfamily member 10B-like protein [Cricetulus griseus]
MTQQSFGKLTVQLIHLKSQNQAGENFINTVTANPIGDHPADPQRVEQSPSEGNCTRGYYLPVENSDCMPCKNGIDYTNSSNNLDSCIPCSVCKEDKDEKTKCTTTKNTECQCKPGTFEDENSPEFCKKCSECTNKEVEETPCTPKTNRKCVPKDSYLHFYIWLLFVSLGLIVAIAFSVWKTGVWCVKGAYPGCERDSENSNTERSSLRGQTSNEGKDSHYSPAAKAPEVVAILQTRVFLFYVYECFVHLYACVSHACLGVRRGHWILWNWSLQPVVTHHMGIKPGSSGRAASALNH